MPEAGPWNPGVIEAERSGSTLIDSTLVVFSGVTLESVALVRTPADSETLNVECTTSDGSGIFVLRGELSEAVMSAPPDLVVIEFRLLVADSVGLTGEEIPEDERVGFEVEKKTVFAPNNAMLTSVALSDIPMSSVFLSSFGSLSVDELLPRMECVDDVVGIAAGGPPRMDSVADRVAIPLRDDVTGLD